MSVAYQAVGWNPQKRSYDAVVAALCGAYMVAFVGLGAWIHPQATAETLLIRGFGTLALVMLHAILAIGPLCRLDARYLPVLYNRRHLGVAMFLAALFHGVFALIQFHAWGDTSPLVSVLSGNTRFRSVSNFPFEPLGLAALAILFLMAATSHDFWLHNLSPTVWKRLHMSVYLAYALIVAHVCLGAFQSDPSNWFPALLGTGAVIIVTLHLLAAWKERRVERDAARIAADGFAEVCDAAGIPDNRAKVVRVGSERIAVFRQGNTISALSNVCRHQAGPLGEGKIVDGCVTCPWHGYQYDPGTGMSPPPFNDRVAVFPVRILAGKVWVQCPR